jgi:hypothetical protein
MSKATKVFLAVLVAAITAVVILAPSSNTPKPAPSPALPASSLPHHSSPRPDAASMATESDDEKAIEACASCYRMTHYKRLSELTMDEVNLIEACKKYGIYHEVGR